MTKRARRYAAPHRADEKVCPICYATTRKRARTWCARGHAQREMLTDNERRRRWLDRHQRQDPHCTCNDCQQAWIDAAADALAEEAIAQAERAIEEGQARWAETGTSRRR